MRGNASILGFGAGVNDLEMMPLLLEHFEMDFFLVAMPYTLLSQEPLENIFPKCQKRGMGDHPWSPLCLRYSCEGSFFQSMIRFCSCGGISPEPG